MVHVNGKKVGGNDNVCKFTAYVSPYFVVSNGGAYTKHIYAANQRIASKLGNVDGFGADPRRVEMAGGKKISDIQKDNIGARFSELGFTYTAPEKEKVEKDSTMDSEEPENLVFFYHPDHLGSTSYVTDADGNIAQHVEYIPYGEVFVEERNNSFSTNYLFNAKELDNETGLYYYGARYLDPTGAMWLSVDPLFEKYAGMSPYNYCAGNPVKLVDPDGREKLVVVGNQGEGPSADLIEGKYTYGEGRRYFLQAGLNRAKEYKKSSNKELVTMLVYKGQYSDKELDYYKSKAEESNINFMTINDDADIADYVNKKATCSLKSDKRASDLISDFTYYGHGFPNYMAVGYRSFFSFSENLDGSEFNKESFTEKANFDLVSCRSGLGKLVENISKLTKGRIRVYNVRVQWGQSSMGKNAKYGLDYYCAFNRNPNNDEEIVPLNERVSIFNGKRK